MCVALFLSGVKAEEVSTRMAQAVSAVLAISAILLIAAFAGVAILQVFGISISAFSVAGGAVLVAIGTKMMLQAQRDPDGQAGTTRPSITPLILFAASPGTITGVITIAIAHDSGTVPVTALIAIGLVMTVLVVTLLVAARAANRTKKPGMARQIVTSYMGLIVIAMGVQFALAGWKDFMAI